MDPYATSNSAVHSQISPVGVCDLGTFTGLILVIRKVRRHWITLHQERHTVDLASPVSTSRHLSVAGLRRSQRVMARFDEVAGAYGCEKAMVVCTAAVRDASNRRDFVLGLRQMTGRPVRVLSPRAEARLSADGATIDLPSSRRTIVVDIGGGSTEVVFRSADRTRFWLTDWGAARATAAWNVGRRDARAQSVSSLCRLQAETIMQRLPAGGRVDAAHPFRVLGVGGTIVTLAGIRARLARFNAERLHGMILDYDWIAKMADRLASMGRGEIAAMIPFDPARARVLTAGTFLWAAVLNRLCANRVTVSVRGLRWGVAARLAEGLPI